jgi:hypothetical protein
MSQITKLLLLYAVRLSVLLRNKIWQAGRNILQKEENIVAVNPDDCLRRLCMYYLQSRAAGRSPERFRFVSRIS